MKLSLFQNWDRRACLESDGVPHSVIHFALIFSVAIACGVSYKKSALLGFIAMLPDLDVFLGVHRSATHSIFVLALALTVALTLKPLRSRKKFGQISFALMSHPTLDLFTHFTPILWPLLNRAIFFKVNLNPLNVELLSSQALFPNYRFSLSPPPAWELATAMVLITMGIALLVIRHRLGKG